MKIFKYILQTTDVQTIDMPSGAVLLSVQFQHGDLCAWALVDISQERLPRKFWIVGTGNPMRPASEKATFLGTVQHHNGALVWHVFSERPRA